MLSWGNAILRLQPFLGRFLGVLFGGELRHLPCASGRGQRLYHLVELLDGRASWFQSHNLPLHMETYPIARP